MRNFIIILVILAVGGVGYWAYHNSEKLGINISERTFQDNPIDLALKPYLTTQIIKDLYPESKVFCSYHTYGTEKINETKMTAAYLWVYCEEYYLQNGELTMGQGISYPIKVTLEEQNGILGVQGHEEPVDGEEYGLSIQKLFPQKYWEQAIRGYDVSKFNPNPETQAKMYFSLN